MGFSFVSAEERNPTNLPPSHEELQAAKVAECSCTDIQAQLDEVNQFIDENNLLKNFYLWQELKAQLKDTSAEVIEDDKLLD
jgi:hypothetical protein